MYRIGKQSLRLCGALNSFRFKTTELQLDAKTWTFRPSVICQAYETAASMAQSAGAASGAPVELVAVLSNLSERLSDVVLLRRKM